MSARRANPVDLLVFQCKAAGLPEPVREVKFHPVRRWRFDLAWECYPHKPIGVEVDGGVYVQGRHSRGAGIEKDCEKYAEAMVLGWRVLRVTPRHIQTGQALAWIEKLLQYAAPRRLGATPLSIV